MAETQVKRERNQSVECVKMLAALMIVILHTGAPGRFRELFDCLGRFAVPFFFAVSGLFSLGLDCAGVAKRIDRTARLNLSASVLYMLFGCIFAWCENEGIWNYLRSVLLNGKSITDLVVLHINPFAGHLWYLTALMVCYLLLWAYVRSFDGREVDYRPLFLLDLGLLGALLLLSNLLPMTGVEIPYKSYRNGWIFGPAFFVFGIFIRTYHTAVWNRWKLSGKKLLVLLAGAVALSLMQWHTYGQTELPVGAGIQVFALMMLLPRYPVVTNNRVLKGLIFTFGVTSRNLYVLHLLVLDTYDLFVSERVVQLVGEAYSAWFRFLAVLVVSCLAAVICERVETLWKGRKQKIAA